MTERLYRIGEAAELANLSVRTLRHWDQAGLVVPQGRTDGGYRLYTSADIESLNVVRYMKPLDISVDDMRALLADREVLFAADGADAQDAAERLRPLLQRAAHRVQRLTDLLEQALAFGVRLRVELETGTPSLSQPVRPLSEGSVAADDKSR
jgi:MerR family transcriptional regulator, copper efflux regulator